MVYDYVRMSQQEFHDLVESILFLPFIYGETKTLLRKKRRVQSSSLSEIMSKGNLSGYRIIISIKIREISSKN